MLNSEGSDSVVLFDSVKLYSNGTVELCGTQAFGRFAEVEATYRDPSDRGFILIRRSVGSDLLRVYEDSLTNPSALAWYQPQSVVGKDGETRYDAWLFSAANNSLPTGTTGTKPLRTALLGVMFLVACLSLFVPSASAVLCATFCAGLTAFSIIRSFRLIAW
ncbi:hypothetical protein Spa11_14260 [Botrimarina mediterranea]|uniref:Uncharacterized protein n=1 Tax=Botrimarina mediterranea TaxID=2528022 RepID=A0A518K612_9BACT|nr:hypothetical protein Spa11_14260 [Botrimarina mediterranea]